jgi:hypothetical protein
MKYKKICDLKKGDRVLLNYGDQNGDLATCHTFDNWLRMLIRSSFKAWEAEVMERPSKDPTVVFLKVFGWETDLGDTYAHQIIGWLDPVSGTFEPIEHTPHQQAMEQTVKAVLGD